MQAGRMAGGKRSRWEALGVGKRREDGGEGRRLGLPPLVPAGTGVGLRWRHIPEQQLIHPCCAPFVKRHSFPEDISSTLTRCHVSHPVR